MACFSSLVNQNERSIIKSINEIISKGILYNKRSDHQFGCQVVKESQTVYI